MQCTGKRGLCTGVALPVRMPGNDNHASWAKGSSLEQATEPTLKQLGVSMQWQSPGMRGKMPCMLLQKPLHYLGPLSGWHAWQCPWS